MAARPLTWHGCLRFPANRVLKGVLETLMPGGLETPSELPCERTWSREHRLEARGARDHLRGRLGFCQEPKAESDAALQNPPALLVKAVYALWSRAFAETDGDLSCETEVSLSQLCDDLGYARQGNGAHRPENKRQVVRLLELLGSLEVDLRYDAPDGSTASLTGPLWEIRVGEEQAPSVRYRVGPWFFQPAWRRFNGAVGLAPAALLELRPDRDAWSLRLGGYLAILARMNGYRPLRLRARTLLDKTGLSQAEARNPARMREKLERALDRLEEAGILGGWDWDGTSSEPDMDDPDALSALAAESEHWRERRILIEWPRVLRAREAALSEARPLPRGAPRHRDRNRGLKREA